MSQLVDMLPNKLLHATALRNAAREQWRWAARMSRTASLVIGLFVLSGCSLPKEVSRVAIPETTLTVVVAQDEKTMYRYRVFEHDTIVSEERLFSGYSGTAPLPPAAIKESSGLVRISWRKSEYREIFLEFDRKTGQIVKDSNMSGRPPLIKYRAAQQRAAGDVRRRRA